MFNSYVINHQRVTVGLMLNIGDCDQSVIRSKYQTTAQLDGKSTINGILVASGNDYCDIAIEHGHL